jgi:two-component system, NtrC family, sensor histidine kinase HydH
VFWISLPVRFEANVDPEILGQVFINLIRNAIESTEEGKTLAIQTSEKGSQVQIAFRHPPSRPIKDADLLFLPFDEGGHSIGLPLSYRLLKDMGGLLSAEKQEDQIVFTLSLPKSGPEPDESKRPGDWDAVPTDPASLKRRGQPVLQSHSHPPICSGMKGIVS